MITVTQASGVGYRPDFATYRAQLISALGRMGLAAARERQCTGSSMAANGTMSAWPALNIAVLLPIAVFVLERGRMQPNDAAAAGGGAPAPAAGASLAGLAVSVLTNPLVAASFTGIRKLEMHPNGSCASVTTVAGFFNASRLLA